MSDTHIRHMRRSRHYMAPVLLDHHSLKKLGLSMVLALLVVFLGGYVVGFNKAEVKLAAHIETLPIELPAPVAENPVDMEPQLPLLAEPGEMIDVDRADETQAASVKEVIKIVQDSQSEVIEKPVQVAMKKLKSAAAQEAEQTDVKEKQTLSTGAPRPLAIGGPAESDPGQEVEQLIQDTATEEGATYSIQVGMYGQLENAERKVEELIATDLSAYLTDYMNKQNKIRYNVRFGYFANRSSARQALATYEKVLSGSGYIVRLQSAVNANAGS